MDQQITQIDVHSTSAFSWVAVDEKGKVAGQGATLAEAEAQAQDHGVQHPAFLKVPPKDAVYVPTTF